MIHLDLFSGIGGFAYAVDQVWDNVEHIFCDSDAFCQQVLKKHWPESEIYGDIKEIITDTEKQGLERKSDKSELQKPTQFSGRVDILTGGFPCQPFSQAGARRGTDDERHLWPQMLEVIRLTKPTWVIAENVGGILTWDEGVVFEQVCSDLENEGYEVQPLIIPAAAVGAPHRRDRVWFVANSRGRRQSGQETRDEQQRRIKAIGADQDDEHSGKRLADDANTKRRGRRKRVSQRGRKRQGSGHERFDPADWDRDWQEVAVATCDDSVDDGVPVELDGFKLTKAQHRSEQLKAYGNAIVPQVAIEIMKGMKI